MQPTQEVSIPRHDSIVNIAAYKFVTLDLLAKRRIDLQRLCKRLKLLGTILLSSEGINLFVAGRRGAVDALLRFLREDPALADLTAKESLSDRQPFNRMLVKIKNEIIAFGQENVDPVNYTSKKLSPRDLRKWLDDGRRVTLLDVRNEYEYRLGTFDNAVRLDLDQFRDFPAAVDKLPAELQRQPIVMFCTGGVRCEKAGPFMEQQGYQDIYQLDGGILKYFEECGDEHYTGECFVFDQRVAVDSELRETETTQCYKCQSPLTAAQQALPEYVPHRSCPYCYKTNEEALRERLKSRHDHIAKLNNPLPGSQPYTNKRPIFIPADQDGQSVLDALDRMFGQVGREAWRGRLQGRFLYRGGMALTPDRIVHAGDRLEHHFPQTVEPDVNGSVEVLFDDEWLVVVNKPAPLPMHPCGRFNRNSLVYILDQVYSPQRLRPAHRLDANTSGVVILCRTRSAAQMIQPQFGTAKVRKKYVARILGHPAAEEFVCDAGISHEAIRAGARITDPKGLAALTEFTLLERLNDGTTLIEARPITGRTNQIRLHLWHLGLPIQGDPTYLPDRQLAAHQTLLPTDPPMCLHARSIHLMHPESGQAVEFEAPTPKWTQA